MKKYFLSFLELPTVVTRLLHFEEGNYQKQKRAEIFKNQFLWGVLQWGQKSWDEYCMVKRGNTTALFSQASLWVISYQES